MLRDGLDGCGLGTGQTAAAGRAAWRSAAHDRCACCRKRHLLSVAHGLPMAPAATPVPTLGHGLPLLAELGAFWNLGAIAPRRLGTGAYGSGTCGVSERGHHGRSIAQDHGARRPARLRRVPACEGTPAPHP